MVFIYIYNIHMPNIEAKKNQEEDYNLDYVIRHTFTSK